MCVCVCECGFTPGTDRHEQWTGGWCLGNAAAISSRLKCQQQAATQYSHISALIPVGNVIGLRHLENNAREYQATKMYWLDPTSNFGHTCSFARRNAATQWHFNYCCCEQALNWRKTHFCPVCVFSIGTESFFVLLSACNRTHKSAVNSEAYSYDSDEWLVLQHE